METRFCICGCGFSKEVKINSKWKYKWGHGSFGKYGDKNSGWKNGVSPLALLIRKLYENKQWELQVFKRDNFTCQKCKQVRGKIEAHHLNKFSNLLYDFLQLYSQFSPIEDKETLLRLAITYEPFWDITNGITLCKKCHKLTSNYKNKKQILY